MKKIFVFLLAVLMTISLAACGGNRSDTSAADVTDSVSESTAQVQETDAAVDAADTDTDDDADADSAFDAVTATANVTSDGQMDATGLFSDRDLRQNADLSKATTCTVADGQDISITAEGIYVLTGSAADVTVTVDATDNDKVQIVLDGVTITNASSPAIYVKNADKVFVTTAEGTENSLTVTGAFTADGETNTDAVIFSKDDLVLNGLGTLNISSSDNGISCKDDLKITGGTLNITCTSDALEANDSIAVADGIISINTGKDGIHAEDDEDNTVGYVYICGGTLNISASSDGIQGTTIVQIDGGTMNITSSEGIESTYVQINGGTINISASDDGINASLKSTAIGTPTVEINGGTVTVSMGQGDTDGIDANGNLYINGGTVDITGNSPFDYDGVGEYNGGTLIVNGSQTNELTNQFMGGGMGGGMGGPGGNMGGGMGGPGH